MSRKHAKEKTHFFYEHFINNFVNWGREGGICNGG